MSDQFDELWHWVSHRRHNDRAPVQVKEEIEHIYSLISGCKSYLEIGTAEGDSLFILAHALADKPVINYVDYGEKHTEFFRNEVIKILSDKKINVRGIHGDSHLHSVINEASVLRNFDVVMIDAGHEYEDVVADAVAYGGLAKKFIIFHDIQLPPVAKAFDWYVKSQKFKTTSKFAFENSPYGFGIITL